MHDAQIAETSSFSTRLGPYEEGAGGEALTQIFSLDELTGGSQSEPRGDGPV